MESILIFVKHKLPFLWELVERINSMIFYFFYYGELRKTKFSVLNEIHSQIYSFRELTIQDMLSLNQLLTSQPESDLEYFKPHQFDHDSLKRLTLNKAFLMMGVFYKKKLIGYFFLRFFFSKKCFVGRLIDENYRGIGIGYTMNTIMYKIAWDMNFRCLSTISRKNKRIMAAHAKNPSIIILKELPNDYLLVEFIREKSSPKVAIK